jgi:hypothetical protein
MKPIFQTFLKPPWCTKKRTSLSRVGKTGLKSPISSIDCWKFATKPRDNDRKPWEKQQMSPGPAGTNNVSRLLSRPQQWLPVLLNREKTF